MNPEELVSPLDQPVSATVLAWLGQVIGVSALARRPESAIHKAADAHVAKLSVAFRYAFAMGRKALRSSLRGAEFNPDQPRDEGGKWTDGVDAQDTETWPAHKAEVLNDLYHVTPAANLDAIAKEGLKSSPDNSLGVDRKPSERVYFFTNPEAAEATARQIREDQEPAIIHLRVPRAVLEKGDPRVDPEYGGSGKAIAVRVDKRFTTHGLLQIKTKAIVPAKWKHRASAEFRPASLPPDLANLATFNPDQPRDEGGEWSDGGGNLSDGHITDKHGREYAVKQTDPVDAYGKARTTYTITDGKKIVGKVELARSLDKVIDVQIHPDYRRKGIASALYDYIENDLATTLKPNVIQTLDGKAFSKSRFRSASHSPNVDACISAIRAALEDVLPATLRKVLIAGGDAGLATLGMRLRAAEFNPDQPRDEGGKWTATVDALPKLSGYLSIDSSKVFPGGIVYKFPDGGQTERPYDGNRLAAALKKQKPELAEVSLTSLIATQEILDRKPLLSHLKDATQLGQGKRDIIIAAFKDKQYIADGHHRVAAALLRGDKTIKVRVVKMDHAPTIKALQEFRDAAELRTAKDTSAASLRMRFDAKTQAVIDWADRHAAELIDRITETSREAINNAVAEHQETGDWDAYYDEILAAVGDEDRANLIARHESMLAAGEGQRQAWDQAVDTGLLAGDEERAWIVTGDEKVCPVCEGLEDKRAKLGESYIGDDGEEYDGPPAHVQCRCTEGIA